MIPTLKGKLVTLAPFSIEDAPSVQRYAGDPMVSKTTLNIPHPYPDGAAEIWIASHLLQFLEKSNIVFSVRSEDSELIGAINIRLSLKNRSGELGYWIAHPFWNKGFATDAATTTIEYGFETFDLNRIHSRHLGSNPSSGRVMEKSGMRKEGILREHTFRQGRFDDIVEYGILGSEYKKANQSSHTTRAKRPSCGTSKDISNSNFTHNHH